MNTEEKKRILIVDDDPSTRETFEALLFPEGHELMFAGTGREGLHVMQASLPDLVLLDLMMPGMDGFSVVRAIKENPLWKHIPVVLITAHESKANLIKGLASGADEFLGKPVRGGELRARVRSMLRIKGLYDELIMIMQMREEMAGMLAHDMKNPLFVIMGHAEMLRLKNRDAALAPHIDKITDQAARLNTFLQDMLLSMKMESGKPVLNLTNSNVSALVRECAESTRVLAEAKDVEIFLLLPEKDGYLELDETLFNRYMDNLLSNALKFSPKDTAITIEVETGKSEDGDKCTKLMIFDEGSGIPDTYKKSIFDKFEVLHLRGKGIPQTGLGLSFCQMVAMAHGWDLQVQDNKPKGSVFVTKF